MKTPLSFLLLFTLAVTSKADVSYSTETPRDYKKGRLQTIIGKRGDRVVHRITRIDRGNTGAFREFTEEFFIDGTTVLSLSEIKGDYMIDCQNLGTGVVSLYYKGGSPRPEKMLIGKEESFYEVYIVTDDGTHVAITDEDRKSFLSGLRPLSSRKRENQLEGPSTPLPASASSSSDVK